MDRPETIIASPRTKKDNTLSTEDASWSPSPYDVSAVAAALGDLQKGGRGYTEGIPWKDHVWGLLLPRARHYVKTWKIRHPQEQTSSVQQRRTSDQYLVQLKKHFISEVFGLLDGDILNHLRDGTGDTDLVVRAAIQKRREGLAAMTEFSRWESLRKEVAQWISNCTKTDKGPRWMQAYNAEYSRRVEITAICARGGVLSQGGSESPEGSAECPQVTIDVDGPLYQGRAYSAKELFAQTQPHKDAIMQQAARLLVDDDDGPGDDVGDGTDIRHWRRALNQVWSDAPSDVRDVFLARASSLAKRVNRGYQHVDRAFGEIMEAARGVQAIDGAYAAVVVETRKWSPATNSWEAVWYVCTTIPSKSSRKLQSVWDFTAYDQKLTDWCDTQRMETDQRAKSAIWISENGADVPTRDEPRVVTPQPVRPSLVPAPHVLPAVQLDFSGGTPEFSDDVREGILPLGIIRDEAVDFSASSTRRAVGDNPAADPENTVSTSQRQDVAAQQNSLAPAEALRGSPPALETPRRQNKQIVNTTNNNSAPTPQSAREHSESQQSGSRADNRDSTWGKKMAALRAEKRKREEEKQQTPADKSNAHQAKRTRRGEEATTNIPRRSTRSARST